MRNRSLSVLLMICLWGMGPFSFAQESVLLKQTKVRNLQDLELLLKQHVPELRSAHTSLQLTYQKESPAALHYSFRQVFQGIPINSSNLSVHMDKTGYIRSFSKKLYETRGQHLPAFQFPKSKLHQQIKSSYGAYKTQLEAQLLWDKDKFIPIYQAQSFSHGSVYQFEVLINAQNGKEISWKDLGLYHTETAGDTSGRGRVFNPNPCTVANVNYGDLFIDSMDFHKTIFES
ncbi:MAG: hypothetical protein AAGD28_23055, partial [Bacteroidota bacterium]